MPAISSTHRLAISGLAALWFGFSAPAASDERPFDPSPFGPAVSAALKERDEQDATQGNRIAIIRNGYDALLLRVHLIRHARHAIAVQTFIWTNDECGRLVAHELLNAARRGVKVRVIVDHMFSDHDPDTVAFLATAHPNFELKHYRPAMSRIKPSVLHTLLASLRSFRQLNQRMHNKVMIFDGTILLTGGRNIENTYFDHSTTLNFLDRDVLAVGAVAAKAVESFEEFWRYRHAVPSRNLADVGAAIARNTFHRYPTRANYGFGPHFITLEQQADDAALIASHFVARLKPVRKATFVSDAPGKPGGASDGRRTTSEVRAILARAKLSVVMQTPYLVLSAPLRDAFRDLQEANPGLRIAISTNSLASTDNFLAYSANYRLRRHYVEDLKLLVHEFKPRPGSLSTLFPRHALMARFAQEQAGASEDAVPFLSLHAKSLVVDDHIAFVGSHNLDPRSDNMNTEAGLVVEDESFAQALRTEIEHDMAPENSWVIARRTLPPGLDELNQVVDGIFSLIPINLWPVSTTSSFELRPGATPLPSDHPLFEENYRNVGALPGNSSLSQKRILTHISKTFAAPMTPML
ncbi:MAG: phospholipase D family protein [Opitutaceae bacterium]|nr:phospholipase D family protein [Opitutaceae bacterium]